MTGRWRWWLLSLIAVALVSASTAFGVTQWQAQQTRQSLPSDVDVVATGPALTGPRIIFRNTAPGSDYGSVAAVPLGNPTGPRTVSDLACDRVAATGERMVCLQINRGVVTTFEATIYGADGVPERTWPLPGVPSRTRISEDSRLVATTAFVTGHAYATTGFSTVTEVRDAAGGNGVNVEEFEFTIDGRLDTSVDRNVWGVTFAGGDEFYATVASGGRTWLVRGDLDARTLAAIREGVECPAISPDGSRVAFKKNVAAEGAAQWAIAVFDFETEVETVLPGEWSVDDQVEWLDDGTVLYGLPRAGAVGDNDIWAVAADGTADPAVFIEHAWSPSVVRG